MYPAHEFNPQILEQGFFIPVGRDRMFAFLHEPRVVAKLGVIIMHACAEEKLWSHRVYVHLSRLLASHGMAVLRIDFRGEGESDLSFETATLATRRADAVAALDFLRARMAADSKVVLLGHRLGSLIAVAGCLKGQCQPDGLVLWDPIYDGRSYLLQMLRQHLSTQLAASGRVTITREELLSRMLTGERVPVEGYAFSDEFCAELCEASWADSTAGLTMPTAIMEVVPTDSMGLSAAGTRIAARHPDMKIIAVREASFWRETKEYAQTAPRLVQATFDWLNGWVR